MSDQPQEPMPTEWRDIPATYQTSKTIGKLYAAIAKAQQSLKAAIKDSKNPDKGNRYASLASVIDATESYAQSGVAIIQIPTTNGPMVTITTILAFEDEWISSEMSMQAVRMVKGGDWVVDASPQIVGSMIAYLRRYTLSPMCLIAQEDDDGERAQKSAQEAKAERERVTQQRIAEEQAKSAELEKSMTFEQKMIREFDRVQGFERLDLFKQLKTVVFPQVFGVDEGEPKYYEILQMHGVQKSNEFKTLKPARAAFVQMLETLRLKEEKNELERRKLPPAPQEPFEGGTDDDLPPELGGTAA
jgi:hypothetical protein